METTTNVNPPRKRFNKTLLVIGAAGIAVLGGLGTAYAKLDLFKSAKTVYLEAEANNFAQLSDDFSQSFNEYEEYIKPYLEKPVHSTTELSQIAVDGTPADPQAEKILDLLKSAKLVIQSNADESKRQQSGGVEVHLKDRKLLTLEYVFDDTKMGFRLPDFYPKYGYVDLKDRDTIKARYGEELPKRLITSRDLYEALKVSRDEVASVLRPYALLYAESLKDSQVTINKNASFSEEGYQTSAREVTVTFTDEEGKALLTKIAEKAKADDKLFDLIYGRYHNVAVLLKDSGYPDVQELSKEEFKKEYVKVFDDMLAEWKKTASTNDQLKMVVLINSDDEILSRKLVITGEQGKEEQNFWHSVAFSNGADTYRRYSLFVDDDGQKGEMTFRYKGTTHSDKTTGTIGFLFNAEPEVKLDLSTTFETSKQDKKETGSYDFTLNLKSADQPDDIALSGRITTSMTKTDSERDSEGTIKVNFDKAAPDMPKGISLNVKVKEAFGKPLSIPAMTPENAVNIATVTDEEIMAIQQEVADAAQSFMMKHQDLFQELMPAVPMP
ncbi:DUF6583 family protein [Brevibacillus thermoruber]|uniref:DUF6583 family protein n=1 Tax=Brevibacillus thermoruber TaxID=33942 RepID=UPI00055996E7|nr:DUF6583 family protein [Brevibacillus thermoruber]